MGSTDFGTQEITFQYGERAESVLFNSLNYKLFPSGIYEGGLLSRAADYTARVAPLVVYLPESTEGIGVRVATTIDVDLDSAVSTSPYIIISYTWTGAGNNFADIVWATAGEAAVADAIIIGKANFNGAIIDVADPFDYTEREEIFLSGNSIEHIAIKFYHTDEIVADNGELYKSKVDDNYGNTPSSSPTEWKVLTQLSCTSGTSFPSSPVFGDEFYRTDLDKWYKYNGTIWMEI